MAWAWKGALTMEKNKYLHSVITKISQAYQYVKQEISESAQMKQQAVLNQVAANNILAIRYDLYEGLRNSYYPNLKPIETFNSIRCNGWGLKQNTVVYMYTLAKINTEVLPSPVLQLIMSNMNKDIAAALVTLNSLYGYEYVRAFYPYLFQGLYIVSIRDLGIDVEISVV